jgi:hypothetical protein
MTADLTEFGKALKEPSVVRLGVQEHPRRELRSL